MTPVAGDPTHRIIAALRRGHDQLAGTVAGLTDDALTGPSGASQWRLCDVLSHLGSGAEITMRQARAAVEGGELAAADNRAIWDRWNAASPREQANGFVEHDADLPNCSRESTSRRGPTCALTFNAVCCRSQFH